MHVPGATGVPGGLAVFSDPSGRRRVLALRAAAVTAGLLAVTALVGVPPTLVSPLQPSGGAGVSVDEVGAEPPGVGSGPLVRVAAVDDEVLRDPYSTAEVGRLSDDEAQDVGDAPYVLQFYGYVGDGTAAEAGSPDAAVQDAAFQDAAIGEPATGDAPLGAPATGDAPTLSLTFDDGPHETWTPAVLDLLSQHGAASTFFVNGSNLVRHPEVAQRAAREGHLVANHTVSHEDLGTIRPWKQRWELVLNDHALRAVVGRGSSYVRLPYDGGEGREFVAAVLSAQSRGYDVSTYDFDTLDWKHTSNSAAIPLPSFDGQDLTLLLHDAGGDRSATLAYLERLLPAAEEAGYRFTTLEQSQPTAADAAAAAQPTTHVDQMARWQLTALYVWPERVLRALFVLALASVGLVGLVQLALSLVRHHRRRARLAQLGYAEPVDVVIAAYDEEPVIERTLRSVLASTQPLRQVLVVDDGSRDGTAERVLAVAREDSRVRLLRQANAGKSAAQNAGLAQTETEVVVTLDADTVIEPSSIAALVRHFGDDPDRTLGAVAGRIQVGNRTRNLLTRWQALEYVVQIGVERAAQDVLGAISIIPGACAAWRRTAVLRAGGYSHDTLAEDCDLSLSLHALGYRVTQDDESVARTEAPDTVDDLLKQRTRWMYGTLQAVAKHRGMLFDPRYGWLGMFVLPTYLLSVVVPVLFLPVVAVVTVLLLGQDGGLATVAPYFLAFLGVQVVITVVGIRTTGESWSHLLLVPVYRVAFELLRAYLVYVAVWTAVAGHGLSWNKLVRTGVLDAVPLAPRPAALVHGPRPAGIVSPPVLTGVPGTAMPSSVMPSSVMPSTVIPSTAVAGEASR